MKANMKTASRLCLDLLNEELRIQIESDRGFDP